MRTLIFATLVAALGAQGAIAQTMQFPANRDVQVYSDGTEQAVNGGGVGAARIDRYNFETLMIDFDTDAKTNFLTANPGTVTWTLHVTAKDNFTDDNASRPNISIQTVDSRNDWAEGDGGGNSSGNFSWTAGTAAATFLYAQTYYKDNGSGLNVVDTNLSLPWSDPSRAPDTTYTPTKRDINGTPYGAPNILEGNVTPAFTNSASFNIADLPAEGTASVVLDQDIINALIGDVNNRGLRFGLYGNNPSDQYSFISQIYTHETTGKGAYLEATVVPEPASILLLLGSVCCLGLRRR